MRQRSTVVRDWETVALPDGLTEIAARAFSGCSKLVSVRLPSTLTSIGEYAFYDCKALADVVVPEKITTLSRSLFAGCTGLKSVTIPAGVKTIDSGGFQQMFVIGEYRTARRADHARFAGFHELLGAQIRPYSRRSDRYPQ